MTVRDVLRVVTVRMSPGYGDVRFDHVVIAVTALAPAVRAFRNAGFEVVPGGSHEGHDTHNALVLLDNGYLELIARESPRAQPAGPFSSDVAELVAGGGAGFAGWALAHDGNAQALETIAACAGGEVPSGHDMARVAGPVARWNLRFPGRVGLLGPLPFFIHWGVGAPSEQLSPAHPNGARAVDRIVLHVTAQEAVTWYQQTLPRTLSADIDVDTTSDGAQVPAHGGRIVEVVLRGPGSPKALVLASRRNMPVVRLEPTSA